MILTADWHLDPQPENEYRWKVFKALLPLVKRDKRLKIVGDICDRADRHPAELVNRLVKELLTLVSAGARITIILGNHDKPLNGPPFWSFLDNFPQIDFVNMPMQEDNVLYLPYSANPAADWDIVDFNLPQCILMHQTVTGVKVKGRMLKNNHMPELPDIPIYSGDIHVPQVVGPVTYIGAPHPVRFGDDHKYRILLVDDKTFEIAETVTLYPIRKCVVEVSSLEELQKVNLGTDDQVRVRFQLPASRADEWAIDEHEINKWAAEKGIIIRSTEVVLTLDDRKSGLSDYLADATSVFEDYTNAEGISGDLYDMGAAILAEGLAEGGPA